MRLHAVLRQGLESIGAVIFLPRGWAGAAILCTLSLSDLRLVAAGLICLSLTAIAYRLLGTGTPVLLSLNLANGFLVGVGLAFAGLPPTDWPLWLSLAAALVALVGRGLANLLASRSDIPLLSLPFVIVFSCLQMIGIGSFPSYAILPGVADSPSGTEALLASFGAVVFLPQAWAGALVLILLASYSRILVLLGLLGWTMAASLHWWRFAAWPGAEAFNSIYAAMAVGGAYLFAGRRSLSLALLTAGLAAIMTQGGLMLLANTGLAVIAWPFNLSVLLLLWALPRLDDLRVPTPLAATPERQLIQAYVERQRFAGSLRSLSLPTLGTWTVWQGCDGPWTHQGHWRHAIDLVRTDARGQTHIGRGAELADYLAWQQAIQAPVSGRVAKVIDGIPDNPIGTVNERQLWGNVVLISDPRGFTVVCAHLACGSIAVHEGQWVDRDTVIGRCGNSGYSPQPHLHVHVQNGEQLGQATLPFAFVNFRCGPEARCNGLPQTGDRVERLTTDLQLVRALSLVLDDHVDLDYQQAGATRRTRWRVTMDEHGSIAFRGLQGALVAGVHEDSWYVYEATGNDPAMRLIAAALPRLPLVKEPVNCRDLVPLSTVLRGWRLQLAELLAWLWPAAGCARVAIRRTESGHYRSALRGLFVRRDYAITIDAHGIVDISDGERELHRCDRLQAHEQAA